ncbi:BBP7 family outer membrane beta-barrel protein [Thalassoroseus pseudoceratinae]|uniref:BBP7 family outer membrane beta-barrel protein n=1 Tax=Thalassoroseus pseudoceratinae TaxID=2713176 RepID=UPI0014213170|nr:BBP7 family outer membrane beta-barrel protein [Thalassoroseus pseudoceratinae]
MPARTSRCVLLGLCLFLPAAMFAPDLMAQGGVYDPGMMSSPGMASVSGDAPPSDYGTDQFVTDGNYPGGPVMPDPTYSLAPPGEWWPAPSFWSIFTKKVLPNSEVRVEWLNYQIDTFGSKVIGAQGFENRDVRLENDVITFGQVPVNVFGQTFTFTVADLQPVAAPTTQPLNLEDSNGFRLTLALPLREGMIEFAYMNIPRVDDRVAAPGYTPNTVFAGIGPSSGFVFGIPSDFPQLENNSVYTIIPVTVDGQFVDPNDVIIDAVDGDLFQVQENAQALIFDQAYRAKFTSESWGFEGKWFGDWSPNNTGLHFYPMIGARIFNLEEQFGQTGITSIGGQRVVQIDSNTENTLFGPQLGFRFEADIWKFTFGAEPRMMVGFNSYEASVGNANVRFAGDPSVFDKEDDLKFSSLFEVGLYGKFDITQNMTLMGGYNFMYLPNVTRPIDNIRYNLNTGSPTNDIRLDKKEEDMHLEGLSVGLEIRFR